MARNQDIIDAFTYTMQPSTVKVNKDENSYSCKSKGLCEFIDGKWFCIVCEKEIIESKKILTSSGKNILKRQNDLHFELWGKP